MRDCVGNDARLWRRAAQVPFQRAAWVLRRCGRSVLERCCVSCRTVGPDAMCWPRTWSLFGHWQYALSAPCISCGHTVCTGDMGTFGLRAVCMMSGRVGVMRVGAVVSSVCRIEALAARRRRARASQQSILCASVTRVAQPSTPRRPVTPERVEEATTPPRQPFFLEIPNAKEIRGYCDDVFYLALRKQAHATCLSTLGHLSTSI